MPEFKFKIGQTIVITEPIVYKDKTYEAGSIAQVTSIRGYFVNIRLNIYTNEIVPVEEIYCKSLSDFRTN